MAKPKKNKALIFIIVGVVALVAIIVIYQLTKDGDVKGVNSKISSVPSTVSLSSTLSQGQT